MPLPRYDEIHLPLLKLIHNKRINTLKDAVEILAQEFGLTHEDLNQRVRTGRLKFYSQVSFSKMLLVRAGLVFKEFIPLRTTDKARQVLKHNSKKITKRYLDDLATVKENMKIEKEQEIAKKARLDSYDEYLQKLKSLSPSSFEQITGLVLSKGYNLDYMKRVEITPPTNDFGIDGILHLSDKEKVYFQSKRFNKGSIGVPSIQQFVGALEGIYGTRGYFVTTSKFAKKAYKYVDSLKEKEITLIDGHTLVELIYKYKLENEIIQIK
ncbi:restriction system protein [Neobacillus niacini]|uniref:restriction endonuclease n=1 Tax=Neobacillus niacini TaxID=86668 RepID=UPI00278349F5|nr:restriction endonuclease [Neobacillus niacini]MDQ0999779.1 restriction system protein [Neobacillus niacini]